VGGAGLGYNDPANGNDLQASTFEFVLRGRPALMTALADQRIDTHCFFQICGAAPQWARISVIMVVASWHDALAADQLPREIVGNWCVAGVQNSKSPLPWVASVTRIQQRLASNFCRSRLANPEVTSPGIPRLSHRHSARQR
jgi:hypothetical protein